MQTAGLPTLHKGPVIILSHLSSKALWLLKARANHCLCKKALGWPWPSCVEFINIIRIILFWHYWSLSPSQHSFPSFLFLSGSHFSLPRLCGPFPWKSHTESICPVIAWLGPPGWGELEWYRSRARLSWSIESLLSNHLPLACLSGLPFFWLS